MSDKSLKKSFFFDVRLLRVLHCARTVAGLSEGDTKRWRKREPVKWSWLCGVWVPRGGGLFLSLSLSSLPVCSFVRTLLCDHKLHEKVTNRLSGSRSSLSTTVLHPRHKVVLWHVPEPRSTVASRSRVQTNASQGWRCNPAGRGLPGRHSR